MQPSVCAICLTADRPEMTRRAITAFRQQSYQKSRLVIYDSGKEPLWNFQRPGPFLPNETYCRFVSDCGPLSIGALRNRATEYACRDEVVLHWDSDDWSAPNRIADQVALLQSGDYEAVGYSSMLFWDSVKQETWLYRHISRPDTYCLGTSLCYWRKTWERRPFPNKNAGEDHDWHRELRTRAETAVPFVDKDPLMVAEIHGRNTAARIMSVKAEWERVPAWDEKLKAIMTI